MEEPGDILKADHREIKKLLSAFDGMAAFILQKDSLPDEDLEKAFAVAVEFADKCHHGKEEKALFPHISKASPDVGAEMARRLTSDHAACRKLVGTMLELVPNATVKKESRAVLAKQLGTYTRLLTEHIKVEEKKLIPEVEKSIEPDQRGEISEQFELIEEETMGHGAHERYVTIIDQLAGLYGKKA
jgi:hemerythrin-like domain-containing protein